MLNSIPIFFSVNDQYVPFLAVAITSIKDHANPQNDYEITILEQDISEKHRQTLAKLAQGPVHIHFANINQQVSAQLNGYRGKLRNDYYTPTIFYRLFIADLFPQYDRALYLDADITLNDDVAKLYQVDLGDKFLAAAPDTFAAAHQEAINYVAKIFDMPVSQYFNSGVLLMDLAELRQHQLAQRFLDLLHQYQFNLMAPDQDYLNATCHQVVKYLPQSWNAMPINERPIVKPHLIHYALFHKPWHYDTIHGGDLFWHYASQTDFYDQIKDIKEHFTS